MPASSWSPFGRPRADRLDGAMICRTPGKLCKVCDLEIVVGAVMHRWYQGYRSPGFNQAALSGYQHVDCRGK